PMTSQPTNNNPDNRLTDTPPTPAPQGAEHREPGSAPGRPADVPGHIRSFVHRRAHITPSQQAALDRLLPQWAVEYQNKLLDFDSLFGRQADTILEIGFGMGETTQQIAQARPHDNFLGV